MQNIGYADVSAGTGVLRSLHYIAATLGPKCAKKEPESPRRQTQCTTLVALTFLAAAPSL